VSACFQDKGKAWLQKNLDKSLEEIQRHLSEYILQKVTIPEPTPDPVGNLLDELDRRAKEKPVLFGLPDLDYLLCGIRAPDLTFIAARPSVGKSAFAFQGAANVARQGKKVLFLALEMSENSIVLRHLLSKVDLTNHQVRKGLSKEVWKRNGKELSAAVEELHGFYKEGNFILYDRANKGDADPADLRVIRELIRIHRPHLVVVDQLEQVKESGQHFIDKRSRFSHVTHTLQEIALQENVAIWCCCQINRDAENRRPTLANLKESGTIEEDATNVILLHRVGDKTEKLQLMECEVAKQKDGECGTIDLMYDAPRFRFYCSE
jgi:replicative DNA helicase